MARSKTWFINISRALPKGDPCAGLAARALVLLGDLRVEQPGIHEDVGLSILEKSGVFYRRMYFLRGLSRTLLDIDKLGAAVADSIEFGLLFAHSPTLRPTFETARASLKGHWHEIRHVRNAIGAHVERQVASSINTVPGDFGAKMEFHSDDGLRPHVAEWLLLVSLFEGATESELEPKFLETQRVLNAAADSANDVLAAIIDTYATRYPLFPT
jgi:hypothetical protein